MWKELKKKKNFCEILPFVVDRINTYTRTAEQTNFMTIIYEKFECRKFRTFFISVPIFYIFNNKYKMLHHIQGYIYLRTSLQIFERTVK